MKLFKIILLMIMPLLLSSCFFTKNSGADMHDEHTINIGIIAYREVDTFITDLMNKIDEIIDEENQDEKIINAIFMESNDNQDIQNEQINQLIEQDVDILCVNIVDRNSAANIIDIAKKNDVPIVFFNREPVKLDMSRWDKVYYVGSKAEESGQLQAEMIIDYWNNNNVDKNGDGVMQYVLFSGEPNHQDTLLRTEYNLKTFAQNDFEVENIVTYTANWQRELAKSSMDICLEVFEQEVEVIICNNDDMALGALDSMRENGMSEGNFIPTFGIDANPKAVVSVNHGALCGTVLNDSTGQARAIVDIALKIANENVENLHKYTWVPYKAYDKK